MVVVVVAALLGAALGLFVRNGPVAFTLSLILTGALHYALILVGHRLLTQPGQEALAGALQNIVGAGPMALAPSLAAAGCAAGLAAIMLALDRREPTSPAFWLPGQRSGSGGRSRQPGIRAKSAVEERAIHDRAETHIDKIMRK